MKDTLLKIFNDPGARVNGETIPAVKIEPIYKVTHSGGYRGNYRGRGRGYHRNYRTESGLNPTDRNGKVMECFKCSSKKHLARYCDRDKSDSERNNQSDRKTKSDDTVYITLLTDDLKMFKLLQESLGMAVLDTGCSKNVVGEDWLKQYEETLSCEERESIKSV